MTRKDQGFTLIELLVVVAIIATLAAILFPVFSRVRENAREAAGLSNLKQIALATTLYSQDSDGMFPVARTIEATAALPHSTRWWQELLDPYIKNGSVFLSPNSPYGDDKYKVPVANAGGGFTRYGNSYKPNIAIIANWKDVSATGGVLNDNGVSKPARTIIFGDTPFCEGMAYNQIDRGSTAAPAGTQYDMYIPTFSVPDANGNPIMDTCNDYGRQSPYFIPYGGRATFAFADGHAKALKVSETFGAGPEDNMWGMQDTHVPTLGVPANYGATVSDLLKNLHPVLQ